MTLQRFELERDPLGEGTVLLEASAGTGKTYALTGILLRLLLEGAIERLEQVLVVTFTVAATDELKNRLRAGLVHALSVCEGGPSPDPFFAGLAHHGAKGARILRQALESFDDVAVATIHGFCKRLLDEAAFESQEPFELELAVDESPLWQLAAEDALRLARKSDSLMLGALQHHAGFDPDDLVQMYRLWQRHPGVQLDPSAPQTNVQVAQLCSDVHGAAEKFDEAAREQIRGFKWLSGKRPFPADATFAMQQFEQTLTRKPELALPLLCTFARSNLAEVLRKTPPPRFDHAFFSECDRVYATLQTAVTHLRSELLLAMHTRLQQHKKQDRVLVFQDLLSRTHAALHDPARSQSLLQLVKQRYRVALIDEFQDTDSLQYGIFATCFQNRPLFLVGDPKQSIYGFRGADLRTYLAARDDAVLQRTLDQNHRSSPELVAAVNHLFARKNAFVTEDIRLPAVKAKAGPSQLQVTGDPGAALRWRFVPGPLKSGFLPGDLSEPRIAADVTAEISRLLRSQLTLDGRPLMPRDIAVLTRTNRQATVVQNTLRAAGIVSAIGKAGDVFETEELIEVERIMLALLRPNDVQRARAAMATRLWGLDATALHALEADEEALELQMQRLEHWRHLWLAFGFVVMKEHMLVGLQTQARLLATPGGERRLTNYQQLFEMLHQAEHEHRLSPEGLFQWLQHERRHQDEIDYERRELRLESDDDAVQILTVHGSKGLQYEIVFCPFLWDGRKAPRKSAIVERGGVRRLEFDIGEDEGWLQNEGERLAEDVRLCYVALTRAKRRCYVYWGCLGSYQSGAWLSSLGWLLRPNPPDTSGPSWQTRWAESCKSDAPVFGAQLLDFVERSNGTMSLEEVPEEPVAEPVQASAARAAQPLRIPTRTHRAMAVHSFTSLTAGATVEHVARDVADPAVVPAAPTPAVVSRGIFGFQRGTAAGQCLHEIIEHIDLQALDAPAAAGLVRTTLHRCGLADAAVHPGIVDPVADVLDNLRALRAALVHDGGPAIGDLCSGARQAEWQFMLPTQADLHGLAAIFARHGGDVARSYAARLASLSQRTLDGFLVGFVDLVAEHDGRYWVFDWKSNHLGHQVSDYGPEAVLQAMMDHDYVLQYHLYVLALHRHLRARLADYDAERHLGGVCYAFLRGASAGATTGMFFDRPAPDLVHAMDRWAEAPAGGRIA